MNRQSKRLGAQLKENLVTIQLVIMVAIFVVVAAVLRILTLYPAMNETRRTGLILYGVLACIYLGFYYYFYFKAPSKTLFAWSNAVIGGIALGTTAFFIPDELSYLSFCLIFVGALLTSVISTRGPSYFLVLLITAFHSLQHSHQTIPSSEWIVDAGFLASTVIAIETIQRLKSLSQKQIKRLEVVNEVSRQIVSTLDRDQLLTLLNAVFQNVLEADTYYLGILNGNEIHMQLFYDDGEYYNDAKIEKKGTLSGWVLDHQQELFLPDLRQNVELEGVDFVLIGKTKGSLSWMGVPMKGMYVDGLMAIASYKPNAFSQSDLELLHNIAQRAALALDNAYHHQLVQAEARLDSLTRVFNHGYFIKSMREKAEDCSFKKQPLSLIMLDVDHFKQYNDTYGHQVGDEILVRLCDFIRQSIKSGDAVGRWGGEEFAIVLPNANGQQAFEVAQRIQRSMETFVLKRNDHGKIPAPTVSQGIAVFPGDTTDTSRLIDIADKRLYTAKERGRNQIEPAPKLTLEQK